jgi:peptide methionine sulfoxide reductase MsrA
MDRIEEINNRLDEIEAERLDLRQEYFKLSYKELKDYFSDVKYFYLRGEANPTYHAVIHITDNSAECISVWSDNESLTIEKEEVFFSDLLHRVLIPLTEEAFNEKLGLFYKLRDIVKNG